MAKIIAAITMSVDGYITGPDDGPDKGLGEGGERLHYWVMGGPWSYENEPQGEPEGEDAAYLNEMTARGGAIVVGRNMYEAAGHWGEQEPVRYARLRGDPPARGGARYGRVHASSEASRRRSSARKRPPETRR